MATKPPKNKKLNINQQKMETPQIDEQVSEEDLIEKLEALRQEKLDEAFSAIKSIEEKFGVGVGLKLDAKKLSDIISYMLSNSKAEVHLQFEVWKS